MSALLRDLRYALRLLRRRPVPAIVAILLCAFSIAAGTLLFAFVNGVLWQPLPFRDSARLVALYESIPVGDRYHISWLDYLDWKAANRTLAAFDVFRPEPFVLRQNGIAERVPGARVSAGFFDTLGVAPILGRTFYRGEDQPGVQPTVVLTYDTWRTRYGGSPAVLGSSVDLEGAPFTVIGVLPPSFRFAPVSDAGYWIPAAGLCADNRGCHPYYGIGRLRPGASATSVSADLGAIARRIADRFPQTNRDRGATVLPLTDAIFGDVRPTLLALLGGAALLSLIGFVNIAGLLLIRSGSRMREMALRAALGATRGEIIRQLALEGMLLAASGCIVALALTATILGTSAHWMPPAILQLLPALQIVPWDAHVVLFAITFAILGCVLFTVGPLLRLGSVASLHSDLRAALAEGGRSVASRGWRRAGAALVVVEWAVTMVLLTGAGLLTASVYRMLHTDIGIVPDHLALLHVENLADASDPQAIALERQIMARVSALPGVLSVDIAEQPALSSGEDFRSLFVHYHVFGRPYTGLGNEANTRVVSTGYLPALRARLVRGRFFTDSDDSTHPRVVIVNRSFVAENFAGQNPIGHRIINEYDSAHPAEIIGVIADIREGPIDIQPLAAVYQPFDQNPLSDFYLAVRTRGPQPGLFHAMTGAIRAVNPLLIVEGQGNMQDRIDRSPAASLHRVSAAVAGCFAAAALVLGVVGLYNVLSFAVAQRTREIGVRMALGATRGAIGRLVLSETSRLAALGIGTGLAGSWATSGLIRSLLYAVSPWNAKVLIAVTCTLAASALLAGWLPARRAASIEPVEALRAE